MDDLVIRDAIRMFIASRLESIDKIECEYMRDLGYYGVYETLTDIAEELKSELKQSNNNNNNNK